MQVVYTDLGLSVWEGNNMLHEHVAYTDIGPTCVDLVFQSIPVNLMGGASYGPMKEEWETQHPGYRWFCIIGRRHSKLDT